MFEIEELMRMMAHLSDHEKKLTSFHSGWISTLRNRRSHAKTPF